MLNLPRASVAFLLGSFAALIWAAVDQASYFGIVDGSVAFSRLLNPSGDHGVSARFLVNELFMVPLFGIVMRDVWRSSAKGGPFSTVRKAAMPLVAAVAIVVSPILIFMLLRVAFHTDASLAEVSSVWNPAGIVYCWLFAHLFGRGRPAAIFLVACALLADLISMLVVAAFHLPEMEPMWLGLVVLSMAFCEGLRRFDVRGFWLYVVVGAPLSWFGLQNAGLHAAFALVPLIPFMARPLGEEESGPDTLKALEQFLAPVLDVGIFVFALANLGALARLGLADASLVLAVSALVIGGALGVYLLTLVARLAGVQLVDPIKPRQTFSLGLLAGLGFALASLVSALFAAVP